MQQRELTGQTVFLCLLAFFGVVGGVNAVLIYAATSTFGGVEVASSYKAGLRFQQELDAARVQDALHWTVTARLERRAGRDAELSVSVRDRDGKPLSGLDAFARLAHPADARRDHVIALKAVGAGQFAGVADAEPAQWDLLIDLSRGGRTVFRSKSRVELRGTP
jgi:nitrogen fixation protein FixH